MSIVGVTDSVQVLKQFKVMQSKEEMCLDIVEIQILGISRLQGAIRKTWLLPDAALRIPDRHRNANSRFCLKICLPHRVLDSGLPK